MQLLRTLTRQRRAPRAARALTACPTRAFRAGFDLINPKTRAHDRASASTHVHAGAVAEKQRERVAA
jgi:hypothetical protein